MSCDRRTNEQTLREMGNGRRATNLIREMRLARVLNELALAQDELATVCVVGVKKDNPRASAVSSKVSTVQQPNHKRRL